MNKKIKLFLSATPLILGATTMALTLAGCSSTNIVDDSKVSTFSPYFKSGKTEFITGDIDTILVKEITPTTAKTYFTFSSSNADIISVDENGGLEALKAGTVNEITVTETNSGVKNSIKNVVVTEGNEDFSLISPAGAPTLAIYDTISSKAGAETTTQVTQIPAYLQSGDKYNYVIFDSINALKLTNNAKKANYTYLGMLTGGNFHLVGYNHQDAPKVGDKIVTFGQNLVPDLALKTCYKDLFVDSNLENITYLNSVSDVLPVLKSGLYQGEAIDYCFIAQPLLFSAMSVNNNDSITTNDILFNENLNTKISEITGGKFDYIPQAGLFVKDDYLKNKPNYVNAFYTDVKKQMKNAYGSDLTAVKTSMEKVSTDVKEQAAKYGFNENIALALQKDNKNQFGIIDPEKDIAIDNINEFLTAISADFQIKQK
jgi:hypothetical protein